MARSKRSSASKKGGKAESKGKKQKREEQTKAADVKVKSEPEYDQDTDEEALMEVKIKTEPYYDGDTDDEGTSPTSVKNTAIQQDTADESESKSSKEKSTTYLWAVQERGDYMYVLPEPVYLFWRDLLKCKTWGNVRAICRRDRTSADDDCYENGFYNRVIMERYKAKYGEDFNKKEIADSEPFDADDLDLSDRGDDYIEEAFPLPLEKIQGQCCDVAEYSWMKHFMKYYFIDAACEFEISEKDEAFKQIREHGGIAKHEPRLLKLTWSTRD